MIDYLEQFFIRTEAKQRGEETQVSSPAGLEPEPVQEMYLPAGRQEAAQAFWQEEGLRRLERALSGPEGPEPLAAARAAWEEPVQAVRDRIPVPRGGELPRETDLERRLRRESRRYDSGFFWY